MTPHVTLEQLFTHPRAFAVTTATPVQRAICRVADGLPLGELAVDDDVIAAFGGAEAVEALALCGQPRELYIIAAIRGAKSQLAAALALRSSQNADLTGLGPGDLPRVSIISLDIDKAKAVYRHLVGAVLSQPVLKRLLIGEPRADGLLLRHPSGRPVEVKIVAGKKAGAATISSYSLGLIADEAPRLQGASEGVINFEDTRSAVLGRLRPGAQIVAVGSPSAPSGPMYEAVQRHFGRPTRHLVVVRANGAMLNPTWWTPERIEELKTAPGGDIAYITDYLAEFADPESAFLTSDELRAVTRDYDVAARDPDMSYAAAMDPAARGNGWTLVIAGKKMMLGNVVRVVVARVRQWRGSRTGPLDTTTVLREVRDECAAYGVATVWQDQHAYDAHASIGRDIGLDVQQAAATKQENDARYEDFRARVRSRVQPPPPVTVGPVELPPTLTAIEVPPDAVLRADLLAIRKRVTLRAVNFTLPTTADGRHADYAPAVVLAVAKCIEEPDWIGAMTKLRASGGTFFG